MRIVWHVDPEDVEKVRAFYEQHRRTPFVKKRIRDNLRDDKPPIAKEVFWERMVGCLLTTQQRSGPEVGRDQIPAGSAVSARLSDLQRAGRPGSVCPDGD